MACFYCREGGEGGGGGDVAGEGNSTCAQHSLNAKEPRHVFVVGACAVEEEVTSRGKRKGTEEGGSTTTGCFFRE